jgi:CheY-like chemotaxis protein
MDKVVSRYLSFLCEGRRLARKILLADDSVTAQNMGRKILADAGYEVVTVNNGSAALKRITEIKPDLIVLDVYMPGYSGLEVCQRLKESGETAHIPVLLTVGKLEPFKPEEARRVRADAHIVKPFEASELLTAITKLEDHAVPQQSDPDTGWKGRLRFPSKKKKEEPEPEPEEIVATASFRDFSRAKTKTDAGETFAVKAEQPVTELVPDIPRDITPEELDVLSAVAAKLDGPTTAGETEAAEKTVAAAAAEPAAAGQAQEREIEKAQTQPPEMPAVIEVPVVNTGLLAEEPAPVDRDDEPLFATAASAVGPAAEEQVEAKPVEAAVVAESHAKAEDAKPAEVSAAEKAKVEERAPSDEELAEALRLLTPATANAEAAAAQEVLVAAGQSRAEEAVHAKAASRWVAETVALAPEESALSLEAEMISVFAAGEKARSEVRGQVAEVNPVSLIAAAVQNRMAEAGLAVGSGGAEASSAAQAVVGGNNDGGNDVGNEGSKVAEGIPAEKIEAERTDFAAEAVAEAPAAEIAATTVAEAAGESEIEAAAATASTEENQVVSSSAGVEESMGKDGKTKSSKSTWHQIHSVPASTGANGDVEAAKQAAAAPEERKAMAAAAAAEGSASLSVTDASTIASIVDSVMADLRPKIVEEIAKKLAGK